MNDPRDRELDRLCGVLARAEEPYDDLARARAESRLRQALGSAPRRRPVFAITAVAALAVALAATFVIVRPRSASRAITPAVVLRPYLVAPLEGGAAASPPGIADGPSLDVPAGWLVRASLNDGVTVSAVGPARLAVTGTASDLEVHLGWGQLLAEVTPGRGTHLRVSTPSFVVAVVGTLFSVDAQEVNVRHGRVRVSANGAVSEIDGGRRWRASSPTLEPLGAETAAALDAHEAASSPPAGAVMIDVAGEPAGAEIWAGGRRLAVTPASLRVAAGTQLEVLAPGHTRAAFVVPSARTRIAYSLAIERAAGTAPPVTPHEQARAHARAAAPVPSTPPPSSPPAPVAAPKSPSPRELYLEADRSLAAGDHDEARAALLAVVRAGGDDTLVDAARIDLATLALRVGEFEAARRYLDGVRGDAVAEPTARLRCGIALSARDAAAAECFAEFRAHFPSSTHDAEAMAEEAIIRADRNDCARALPLLESASSRALPSELREGVRTRLSRCRR